MDQPAAIAGVKNHIEKPFVFKGPNLPAEGDIPDETIKAVEAWTQNEFLCKNYILNALDDSLYDVYLSFKTPKELWDSLNKKYKSEVASAKKFIVGKFLNFRMSDTYSVVKQVEELQVTLSGQAF
ncbi:hypothetical protein ACLB2K_021497 [Fragaria x ananassa]